VRFRFESRTLHGRGSLLGLVGSVFARALNRVVKPPASARVGIATGITPIADMGIIADYVGEIKGELYVYTIFLRGWN